ncbi:MAG: hypothetical protein M0042_05275 [Nitrospiraceae bacterium]|nr:hypothetical protein [Nitrospiraceae bacterium]
MKTIVLLTMLVVSAACSRGESPDLSKLGPSSAATTTVLPAGSQLCPGGGIRIDAGNDGNANGVLEPAEVSKGLPVCDSMTEEEKPAGHVVLVKVVSEPTGTEHCAAGGVKVLSGPDGNGNGVLDAEEAAVTEYLCNGAPGKSSAADITVAVGQSIVPCPECGGKKKGKKQAPAKKPAAGAAKPAGKKEGAKAAPKHKTEASAEPPVAKKESAEAEAQEKPAESAAPAKKAKGKEKTKPAAAAKEKKAAPKAAPQGWTAVKVNNPQLASVAYRLEGRYITVRFTNLSASTPVRFKYTVKWKVNQNGSWVPDSTMENISFRLKAQETLDREVRTNAQEVKDVTIDIDVVETS